MGEKVTKFAQPLILNEGEFSLSDLHKFKENNSIWHEHDLYQSQLVELFDITYPNLILDPKYKTELQQFVGKKTSSNPDQKGAWVYFPWSGYLIHVVGEKEYFDLRTNRNRNLITQEEQQEFKNVCVGIAGMSVGAEIAVNLAYSGVGSLRLADQDIIETANLNRLKAGLQSIGEPKVNQAAQRIYEINPFAQIDGFTSGLHENNLHKFIAKLNVVFDEIDDFQMKIRLRQAAREAGIPVLMLTSLGDTVLIDVERYDITPNLTLFNGLIGDLPEEILNNPVGESEKIKYAMMLPGIENIPTRALATLSEINKTIVGRPQLGSTVSIDGGVAAYVVKRIALGWDLPSGRYKISLDQTFDAVEQDADLRQSVLGRLNMGRN